jgi:hypothetical protein
MNPKNTGQGTENCLHPGSSHQASATSVSAQLAFRCRYPWSSVPPPPPATETETSYYCSPRTLDLDQLAAALFAGLRDDPAATKSALNILTQLRELDLRKQRVCPTCHQPVPPPASTEREGNYRS